MEPVFKTKEEIKLKKLEEERKIRENRILEMEKFRISENITEEEKENRNKKQK